MRHSCTLGRSGCRKQYVPVATGDTGEDPETEKQQLLASHLWARALPSEGGYAPLWDGALYETVQKLCVGPGDEGVYYVTLTADATLSGDGRLSASADGFSAVNAQDNPVEGVDSFGWWKSAENFGCFCCGDDYGAPLPPLHRSTAPSNAMCTKLNTAHDMRIRRVLSRARVRVCM